MNRIKKGDEVIVIAGKDKGRRGTVLRVNEPDDQVLIEGINVVKKHQKPNPNSGVQGGIVDQERAIHVSNVMLFNPATGKGDRVGVKTLEDGRRVRFFKSNNEVVDV
jgi:large subunit ribosomal protein L24